MALRTNMDKHPRTGVYRFRKSIPPELRPFLPPPHTGKRELIKTLATKDPKEASRIHVEVALLMERILDQARQAYAEANSTQSKQATNADKSAIRIDLTRTYSLPPDLLDDDFFISIKHEGSSPQGSTAVVSSDPLPDSTSLSINSVFNAYVKERTPAEKTANEFKRSWRLLCEISGLTMDSPITALSKHLVRQYKQELFDYPAFALTKELRSMGTRQLIDHAKTNNLTRISKANINKHLAGISAVCRYATRNYDVPNPVEGMLINISRDEDQETKRIPYTADDLNHIFSQPIFTKERWNNRQWLPILALYTGCRGEELAQLLVSDIREENEIPYLSIQTRDEDGNIVKTVKAYTARRNIPLHKDVIALGLLDFVKSVEESGNQRLFYDLTPYKGRMFANYTKWWGHQRTKFRIADKRKTFHSFRHLYKDICHRAFVPDRVQDAIMGHANDAMGEHYGSGRDLPTMAEWVGRLTFPVKITKS